MKRIIFAIISLLLISSVSALSIGSVRYFEDVFLVNVHNDKTDDLEDLSVKITIIDDGDIYRTKTFDLDPNKRKGTYVIIDKPLETEKVVKVTVRSENDDVKRVKYFII